MSIERLPASTCIRENVRVLSSPDDQQADPGPDRLTEQKSDCSAYHSIHGKAYRIPDIRVEYFSNDQAQTAKRRQTTEYENVRYIPPLLTGHCRRIG